MFLPQKRKAEDTWDGVLCVPFEQKDRAKALGAGWDAARRAWVVPPALRGCRPDFRAWDPCAGSADTTHDDLQTKRAGITRELAKAVGATRA